MPENGSLPALVNCVAATYSVGGFSPVARRLDALATALAALDRAVTVPGPAPEYHARVMAKHRDEWPTLWSAIDALRKA
jgi:hypothetical protein